MLTIIIPHYNSPAKLETLLNSINFNSLTQIIVIDDNSNRYLDELNTLRNSKIYSDVLFLKNNSTARSAGKCRNIGLAKATGKWIIFADADDYFIEGYYNIIEKYFTSTFDVVLFTPTSIDVISKNNAERHVVFKTMINEYINNKDKLSLLNIKYKIPEPWSKLIKHEFIKTNDICFDETIAANDRMFSTKLAYYMDTFKASEETIYCVTASKGSLTMDIRKHMLYVRMYVYIDYYHFLNDRLTEFEMKILNIDCSKFIIKSILRGYGLNETYKIYRILRKNKLKLFDVRMLNPYIVFKALNRRIKRQLNDRKYYIK